MIEWKTPPARSSRWNTPWDAIAAELRRHPGEWGLVARDVHQTAVTHIRNGRLAAFRPAGAFEATSRGKGPRGRCLELFARYVGEPDR